MYVTDKIGIRKIKIILISQYNVVANVAKQQYKYQSLQN